MKNVENILQNGKMAVESCSKQSLETKPPQFSKLSQSFELVTKVIIINVVIGGFSGEDLN